MLGRIPLTDPNYIPGGGITAGLRNANAVTRENLENEITKIKAQYAPLTTQAQALSQLAYASLVGPQFMSKLMGNESILANLTDEQKSNILKYITNPTTGQLQNQSINPNLNNNALLNNPILSAQDRQGITNLTPGNSYTIPQSNMPPSINTEQQNVLPNSTFAENVGKFKGLEAEGQESGKIRAKDIDKLNTMYFNGQTNHTTLENLSKILSSPQFEQIRQLPLAGHKELSYYAKFGTPEQQNMIGQYYTLIGNIIKDSARDFPGQFRKGEQQLLQGMKPNPSDTVDTARGKLEQLSTMNKMVSERARLTSEIMSKKHINKLEAQELADKQLNGDAIRQSIHDQLNPTVTIRNKKTGETKTISISEARKLGVPNV